VNAQELDAQLTKRLKKRSNGELLFWLQQAFAGCMRYAEEYQEYNDTDALGELNLNLGIVNAVVDELVVRQEAKDEEDRSR
jgi:hypothetical protein